LAAFVAAASWSGTRAYGMTRRTRGEAT